MLARAVVFNTIEYFEDPEHRRDFETWYFAKYGVKYNWKKVQK